MSETLEKDEYPKHIVYAEESYQIIGASMIEIKAIAHLTDEAEAQALHYLKATGYKLAILINFGNPKKLEYRRVVA